jgi:hypothetical protein
VHLPLMWDVALLIKRLCAAGPDNGAAHPVQPAELRDRLAVTIQRGNAMADILTAARLRANLAAFHVARPKVSDQMHQRARAARRNGLSQLPCSPCWRQICGASTLNWCIIHAPFNVHSFQSFYVCAPVYISSALFARPIQSD